MKTNKLKMASVLLLGLIGLENYSLVASADAKPMKKIVNRDSRLSRANLSSMKINNIEFAFNKATVPVSAYENLDKVAKLMSDNKASLNLGGYADNRGGYVYNWKLSKVRANAVKAYLVSKGSDSTRIASVEYGYTHPIASNKTPQGRQKNRRVEIHFAN